MSGSEVDRFAECIGAEESPPPASGMRVWANDADDPVDGCVFDARYFDSAMHLEVFCGYT